MYVPVINVGFSLRDNTRSGKLQVFVIEFYCATPLPIIETLDFPCNSSDLMYDISWTNALTD